MYIYPAQDLATSGLNLGDVLQATIPQQIAQEPIAPSWAASAAWLLYSGAGVCAGVAAGSRYAAGEAILGLRHTIIGAVVLPFRNI